MSCKTRIATAGDEISVNAAGRDENSSSAGTVTFGALLFMLLLCTVLPGENVGVGDGMYVDKGVDDMGKYVDAIDTVGVELCRLAVPAAKAVTKLVWRSVGEVGAVSSTLAFSAVNMVRKSAGAVAEKTGRVEADGTSRD